jgi:DNA recombination protein RmuC
MTTILYIIFAAIVGAIITFFAGKSIFSGKIARLETELQQTRDNDARVLSLTKENYESSLQQMRESHEAALRQEKAGHAEAFAQERQNNEAALKQERETHEKAVAQIKENYEKTLAEMKQAQEKVLKAAKDELTLENEKLLKEREESLKKEAHETIKTITDDLEKSIKTMKESFDAQKEAQTKGTESIKTQLDETVKNLHIQTENIGRKADNLSDALRGSNKIQGNWGEMKLDNILQAEGFTCGGDYDKEDYLRDEQGNIIQNDETGKKMRPDFIIHMPDNLDLIVDCKVNLDAYLEWYNATNEAEKAAASKRNLLAMEEQIKNLASKSYIKYILPDRKSLDYVIMFVSNYGAFQLAKQENPRIFQESFNKNVLITTEETIIPFLRMIHRSWINYKQEKNQEALIKAATNMVDRVALFKDAYVKIGDALNKAVKEYENGNSKLQEGGQSILKSAREVIKLGVKVDPKKDLLIPKE